MHQFVKRDSLRLCRITELELHYYTEAHPHEHTEAHPHTHTRAGDHNIRLNQFITLDPVRFSVAEHIENEL